MFRIRSESTISEPHVGQEKSPWKRPSLSTTRKETWGLGSVAIGTGRHEDRRHKIVPDASDDLTRVSPFFLYQILVLATRSNRHAYSNPMPNSPRNSIRIVRLCTYMFLLKLFLFYYSNGERNMAYLQHQNITHIFSNKIMIFPRKSFSIRSWLETRRLVSLLCPHLDL